MKFIKTFENINEPQIGDYVICKEFDSDPDIDNFIENNIGQYIKPNNNNFIKKYPDAFLIQYKNKNIPDSMNHFFNFDDEKKGCRPMDRKEIIFFSPNKKDCEIYLLTKKYNI